MYLLVLDVGVALLQEIQEFRLEQRVFFDGKCMEGAWLILSWYINVL
jgi:hypothetical protein